MNISQIFAQILESFFLAISKDLSEYHLGFIKMLSGEPHRLDKKDKVVTLLERASKEILIELSNLTEDQKSNLESIHAALCTKPFEEVFASGSVFRRTFWSIFSVELMDIISSIDEVNILNNSDKAINALRKKRIVKIISKNPQALEKPAQQILFTSNILLTTPLSESEHLASLPPHIIEEANRIAKEEKQLYWYDHPMPIGVSPEANEMLYGLKGLSRMLDYEIKQGKINQDTKIQVLLSVSVTHRGLSKIAQEYLHYELKQSGNFEGLEIFILTERETQAIAHILDSIQQSSDITSVFGVDGRYGRHYSVLKAVAPLWKLCMNSETLATFKIDLDQVFPQEELVKETNKSVLEHFKTELWGAIAEDEEGNTVELGMIAGALVNESDISQGLFTPDVALPQEPLSPMDIFFPRTLAMAISTRAEMMTKYGEHIDSAQHALQRIHVTGGTNGILISSLLKYRPFTPSFIGRAEDQAYLMSVYNKSADINLRYLHASGLIMRHDKAAFAGDAIKAAKLGTYVGDLQRTLLFSAYGANLKGGLSQFKSLFSPFTSCFSSETPVLAAVCRLLMHSLSLDTKTARTQLELAAEGIIEDIISENLQTRIMSQFEKEKTAWNNYYDSLEVLMKNEHTHTQVIHTLKGILEACRI